MAFMFARVELHDAQNGDYERLHGFMEAVKFTRRMNLAGKDCDLPWAYYCSGSYENSPVALAAVKKAADQTKRASSMVVSKATDVEAFGLKNCSTRQLAPK